MSAPAKRSAPDSRSAPRPDQGEVQATTVPYLFQDLYLRKATGVLAIADGTVRKEVCFQAGTVQFATSTDRDDRFNQILLKAGVVPLKSVMRALEVSLSTRDRLGEVMVCSRMITAADIDKWVKVQVREIIYSLFNRTAGAWSFEDRPVLAESIVLQVPGDVMVVEGVRRVTSWARIYEEVGGLNAEYLATRGAEAIAKRLPLLPGEVKLLEMCRTATSLGEMCEASDLGDFQVCRSLWALLIVGAVMKS